MRSLAIVLLALAACGGESAAVPTSPPASASPPAETAPAKPVETQAPATPPSSAALYFPPRREAGAWETIAPSAAGFDPAKLDAVTDFVGQTGATTFAVLARGRLVVEKAWGVGEDATRDVASAQKSVVSLLTGIAVGKGLFALDDEVTSLLGAGWSNDTPANEAGITVRHLLTMTSGLDTSLERVAAPGSAWLYNTDAYHRLELVLETRSQLSLQELTRQWLLDPIGAGPSAWTKRAFQKDAKGVPVSALEMSARDMARVGLVVLAEGRWADTPLVPAAYLSSALSPSQQLNPGYGLLWWLNGQTRYLLPPSAPKDGMLVPSGPPDLVAALGAADQKIYVSRSTGLVVVRQGKAAASGAQALSGFDDELWKRIMAARMP